MIKIAGNLIVVGIGLVAIFLVSGGGNNHPVADNAASHAALKSMPEQVLTEEQKKLPPSRRHAQ